MPCEDACFTSSTRIIQGFVGKGEQCFWQKVEEEIAFTGILLKLVGIEHSVQFGCLCALRVCLILGVFGEEFFTRGLLDGVEFEGIQGKVEIC